MEPKIDSKILLTSKKEDMVIEHAPNSNNMAEEKIVRKTVKGKLETSDLKSEENVDVAINYITSN
jgi:hypothetical protein